MNCTIVNNDVGVSCSGSHGITLTNSTVAFNDTGIILHGGGLNPNEPNSFHQNIICSNNIFNLVHTGSYNEDLTNNCWCITDSAIIETTIFDGYDNVNLGLVDFTPLNTCILVIQSSSFCSGGFSGISNPSNIIYSYIIVYPNPAHQFLVVELPQQESYNLTVIDLTGRIVYENKTVTGFSEIDCANFNNGIYFVCAINDKATLTSKLIKQ